MARASCVCRVMARPSRRRSMRLVPLPPTLPSRGKRAAPPPRQRQRCASSRASKPMRTRTRVSTRKLTNVHEHRPRTCTTMHNRAQPCT
eukprot:1860899-Pleurochrysis_carterae.AAC.1